MVSKVKTRSRGIPPSEKKKVGEAVMDSTKGMRNSMEKKGENVRFNPDRLVSMPILQGMYVDLESLHEVNFNVSDWVDALSLRSLLTVNEPTYDELVREFYRNLKTNMNRTKLNSNVRNVVITVDCKLLETLFGIKRDPSGFCVKNRRATSIDCEGYDDSDFKASILEKGVKKFHALGLNASARFMHIVIFRNLLPKSSSRDKCSLAERIVMWHLVNKKSMNFSQQIIYNIIHQHRFGKKKRDTYVHLPHGNLLTVIFKHFNVPMTVNDKMSYSLNKLDGRYWLNVATFNKTRGWVLSKFLDDQDDVVIHEKRTVVNDLDNEEDYVRFDEMECDADEDDAGEDKIYDDDDDNNYVRSGEDDNGRDEGISCRQVQSNGCDEGRINMGMKSSAKSTRKLLVLDYKGLISSHTNGEMRPHAGPFLMFLIENFDVGYWTSRLTCDDYSQAFEIVGLNRPLLELHKFIWDQRKCVVTDIKCSPHSERTIVFKDLRSVWEVHGEYNSSNTVLIDDSPCQGFLNSENNCIFRSNYTETSEEDTFLEPNGPFVQYLKELSIADDVAEFIRRKRFGRSPLGPDNIIWKICVHAMERCKLKRQID